MHARVDVARVVAGARAAKGLLDRNVGARTLDVGWGGDLGVEEDPRTRRRRTSPATLARPTERDADWMRPSPKCTVTELRSALADALESQQRFEAQR